MTGGYGKSISHVIIGLKTVKGTKQLKLDPTIYDVLIKEKVSPITSFALQNKFLCVMILKLLQQISSMLLVLLLYVLCMYEKVELSQITFILYVA